MTPRPATFAKIRSARRSRCTFKPIGKTILEQPIDAVQAAKILKDKKSDVLEKFISKSGKPFPAFLVMDEKGKITFEFPAREE